MKPTRATLKSFVKKNFSQLLISRKNSFDAMTVTAFANSFHVAATLSRNGEHHLAQALIWAIELQWYRENGRPLPYADIA